MISKSANNAFLTHHFGQWIFEYFDYICQVIIAFGDPEFFHAVFPMLYEMCNTASVKMSTQVQAASDAVKTGCYTTTLQSHESYALIDNTFASFVW